MAGKKKNAQDPRGELARELTDLIPQLDEEGLAFLIEQARVHLYNMKVAELEAAGQEIDQASARRARAGASPKDAKASDEPYQGLSIKAGSGGTDFHIVRAGKWKLFSAEEMLALTKIATVDDPELEVSGRLYQWLKRERSDFFADFPARGPSDPLVLALVALIKKTFTVKR